jgi:hypothetical protein
MRLLFLQGMQNLSHLPYLKMLLFVYTPRLLPETEGKYIRQESEKFRQESGYVTFFALRPRQIFKFHLFLCLETYCPRMTQNEVTVFILFKTNSCTPF